MREEKKIRTLATLFSFLEKEKLLRHLVSWDGGMSYSTGTLTLLLCRYHLEQTEVLPMVPRWELLGLHQFFLFLSVWCLQHAQERENAIRMLSGNFYRAPPPPKKIILVVEQGEIAREFELLIDVCAKNQNGKPLKDKKLDCEDMAEILMDNQNMVCTPGKNGPANCYHCCFLNT